MGVFLAWGYYVGLFRPAAPGVETAQSSIYVATCAGDMCACCLFDMGNERFRLHIIVICVTGYLVKLPRQKSLRHCNANNRRREYDGYGA